MDAKSEAFVLERLKSRIADFTVLVIAHRLATVRHCQQIVLMQNGVVVDQGSHNDLVEKEGPYKQLVNAQTIDATSDATSEKPVVLPSTFGRKEESPVSASTDESDELDDLGSSDDEKGAGSSGVASSLFRVLILSKSSSHLIALGLFAAAVSGGTLLGEAIIFGHLIDILNDSARAASQANFFCLMFFVVALAALLAHCTSGYSFGIVSERLISDIQHSAMRTILVQDMDWFSSTEHSPHHLVSSMSSNAGKLSGLSGPILGTVISATVSVVGGIILAHVVAWKMAIVLLACVPVMLLSGFLRLKVLAKSEDRQQNAYRDATALASEACSNIRTVASLGIESELLHRYEAELDVPYKQNMKYMFFANILLAFSLSITYFIYALAYWWLVRFCSTVFFVS